MSVTIAVVILLIIIFIAANLPWLSEQFLVVIRPKDKIKKAWMCWLEWLILYFLIGLLSIGLEKKITGEIYTKDWEFYAIGFCLFLVFAFPGFMYRYELKQHIKRWQKRKSSLHKN